MATMKLLFSLNGGNDFRELDFADTPVEVFGITV